MCFLCWLLEAIAEQSCFELVYYASLFLTRVLLAPIIGWLGSRYRCDVLPAKTARIDCIVDE